MGKNIIIIICGILITLLVGLNIYQYANKNEEKIETNYTYICTKGAEQKEGTVPGTNNVVLDYNDVGLLLSIDYITEYIYSDKNQYDSSVKFYNEYGTNKYEFDDKNLEIRIINNNDYVNKKDENGNKIDSWVKTYIDNYKKQGYICKKK